MAGYCKPYTKDEQAFIIRYIHKEEAYNILRGNTIWKYMEKESLEYERTWQSLKNHFSKYMIGRIEHLDLNIDADIIRKVKHGYENSAVKRRRKAPTNLFIYDDSDDETYVKFPKSDDEDKKKNTEIKKETEENDSDDTE